MCNLSLIDVLCYFSTLAVGEYEMGGIMFSKSSSGFIVAIATLTLALITGCATGPKTPIASIHERASSLDERSCANNFRRIDTVVRYMADYERTPFQLRESANLNIFDTGLLEKWHVPRFGHNAQWWIYQNHQHIGQTPHIMNYDFLGDVYYYGCTSAGIQPDPVLAAKFYEFAAIGHVARSQYRIGRMMVEGDGIQRSEEMGIKWLTSAALEGDRNARAYLNDLGVEVPAAIAPNTFSRLAHHERALEQNYELVMQQRAQQRRQNIGEFFTVAIVALGAFYVADAAISGVPQQAPAGAARASQVRRSQPVFCQSNINLLATSNRFSTYATGTMTTFCQ